MPSHISDISLGAPARLSDWIDGAARTALKDLFRASSLADEMRAAQANLLDVASYVPDVDDLLGAHSLAKECHAMLQVQEQAWASVFPGACARISDLGGGILDAIGSQSTAPWRSLVEGPNVQQQLASLLGQPTMSWDMESIQSLVADQNASLRSISVPYLGGLEVRRPSAGRAPARMRRRRAASRSVEAPAIHPVRSRVWPRRSVLEQEIAELLRVIDAMARQVLPKFGHVLPRDQAASRDALILLTRPMTLIDDTSAAIFVAMIPSYVSASRLVLAPRGPVRAGTPAADDEVLHALLGDLTQLIAALVMLQ